MKKTLALIIALAMIVGCLVACSKPAATETKTEAPKTETKAEEP